MLACRNWPRLCHFGIRRTSAIQQYAQIAHDHRIDLTVVGPEQLLVDGLVDEFQQQGLRTPRWT